MRPREGEFIVGECSREAYDYHDRHGVIRGRILALEHSEARLVLYLGDIETLFRRDDPRGGEARLEEFRRSFLDRITEGFWF